MNDKNDYFNVITTGYAYLNRARIIEPEGADAYLAVTAAMLEGNKDKPRYQYIDLIVRGDDNVELIKKYFNEIESKDVKTLAAINIGSLKVKSFTFERGEKKGKPGATLKGVLIKITHMKVDGNVVFSSKDDAPKSDEAVSAASVPSGAEENESDPKSQPSVDIVSLSKEDPNFETKKAALKANGYRWHRASETWQKPLGLNGQDCQKAA